MQVISTQTAERYTWADSCDGWHLLRSDEVSVIQEKMPPKSSEASHFHARSRQFFYVLSGTLTIVMDGSTHTIGTEQGLEIPPKTVHRVFNDGESEVRFLVVSAPPSHGDRTIVT